MKNYRLPPNVFVCQANGHFIFLDLKKDKYTGLERPQTQILNDFLHGPPSDYDARAQPTRHERKQRDRLVQSMMTDGLLTVDSLHGKQFISPSISQPTARLLTGNTATKSPIKFTDIWNFYVASAQASVALRWLSIERIVVRARRRKQHGSQNAEIFDFEEARRLVEMFDTLRVFYAREYLCLFDSLALINFLSRYDVYPSWVYGVTAEPFEAHCWVQEGDYAFNEAAEVVANYTPIMVV